MHLYFIDQIILCLFLFLWIDVNIYAKNARNMFNFKGIEPMQKDHNMIIFVLDRTIWPFQVDKLNKSLEHLSEIKQSDIGNLTVFPEVHTCLDHLQRSGYVLAAICNCALPNVAENLLDTFDLTRYFAYQVCSEREKISAVETLHSQSGVDYEDMLYLDYDLRENLPLINLNITFCPVDDRGVSLQVIEKSLALFAVRTTLRPSITTKERNTNESSEYSIQIDYKNLHFKKPNTEELESEFNSEESEYTT